VEERRLCDLGNSVQVDPVKPKLKPPGFTRLRLKCDMLLSTSAFKGNLRRYIWDNRVLLHAATPFDADKYQRLLFRMEFKGEPVIGPEL